MNRGFRWIAPVLIVAAGCGETEPSGEPSGPLVIVASPTPSDTIGARPVQALVIEARDAGGDPAPGTRVELVAVTRPRPGGGPAVTMWMGTNGFYVGSHSAVTDSRGRVTVQVEFGDLVGPAGIDVTIPALYADQRIPFTVTPGRVTQLRLDPQDTALAIGRTMAVRTRAADRAGNIVADPVVFSATSTPGAGAVTSTGQVTASGIGSIVVRGSVGPARDSIVVRVVPVGTVAGFNGSTLQAVLIDLDGSNIRIANKSPMQPGMEFEPEWSRDGSSIVFTAPAGRLGFLDVGTGAVTSVQAAEIEALWPTFSPDGEQLYFSTWDGTIARIARINQDGSGYEVLSPGPFDSRASFAPDGKTLIYHGWSGDDWVLTKYDVAAKTAIPTPRHGVFPEWSPQGDRIAYFTPPVLPSASELRIMNADGSQDELLAPLGRFGAGPLSWSPDGQWLMFRNGVLIGASGAAKGVVVDPRLPGLSGFIWRPEPK